MKRLSPLLLCLLLLSVTACKHDQRPKDIINVESDKAFDDTMVDVLTDLYLIDGVYAAESQYRFDTPSPEVVGAIDAVLEKHHITREQLEKCFDYYSEHPDEYKAIQEQVAARIDKLTASDGEYSR